MRRLWLCLLVLWLMPALQVFGIINPQPVDDEASYQPYIEDTDEGMSSFWWKIVDDLYASDDGEIYTFYLNSSQQAVPAGILRVLNGRDVILELVEPAGNTISINGLRVPPIDEERTFVALDVIRYTYDYADHVRLYEQSLVQIPPSVEVIPTVPEPSSALEESSLPHDPLNVMTDVTPTPTPFTPSPPSSSAAFDPFDNTDQVITGTIQQESSSSHAPSMPQLPEGIRAEVVTPSEPVQPEEPALSVAEVSYLVISIALLIPLGAGLLTYSILHKKRDNGEDC